MNALGAIGTKGRAHLSDDILDVVVLAGGGVAHTSGGVGTLMLYLMEQWAADGAPVRVQVIDTRGQGGVAGGIACFMRAVLTLIRLAAAKRVSLVHAHMTTRGSTVRKCLLCALAAGLGRPSIVHMHGADFMAFYAGLPLFQQRLIGRVLRRAMRVVALGEAWRPFLAEMGVAPERIDIVMNGVRAPAARQRGSAPSDGLVRLLFLGRLGARKGVPELVAALAQPALRDRPWAATLAGDGEVAQTREAVAQAGLAARVAVPGWVGREATLQLLQSADILVLPSHHEAMPIAVIEALAHRVAVVTTPVGVIPEVLRHGVDALLLRPGDPGRLADALLRVIDDDGLRRRLAEAGHQTFRAKFDAAVAAPRMLALYRDAMADHAALQPGARRSSVQALLGRLQPIEQPAEVVALTQQLTSVQRPTVISFVNQHAVNLAWRDPHFAALLADAQVLLRDGLGLAACLRVLGRSPGLNMNGTDFIPTLAAAFAGRRLAIFGTRQPWLDAAADALAAAGCEVVAVLDGFQPEGRYVAAAWVHAPDLLLLAMGMPKQERVAAAIAASTKQPMVIVNGGAVADFLGARFARAPAWMRRLGLEWAFRLGQEPRRLWRRYLNGGVVFGLRVLRLRLGQRDRLSRPVP